MSSLSDISFARKRDGGDATCEKPCRQRDRRKQIWDGSSSYKCVCKEDDPVKVMVSHTNSLYIQLIDTYLVGRFLTIPQMHLVIRVFCILICYIPITHNNTTHVFAAFARGTPQIMLSVFYHSLGILECHTYHVQDGLRYYIHLNIQRKRSWNIKHFALTLLSLSINVGQL